MSIILVINPNSNPAVTRGFDKELEPLRHQGGPQIICETLEDGPFGIEQTHVESVTLPLACCVTLRTDASAFIITCDSDPGLFIYREVTTKPVLGISKFVELTATTPAHINDLPSKGFIAIGMDADIAIWDPDHLTTLSDNLHDNTCYNPFSGRVITDWPQTVLRRGYHQ
jgi:hypothetical protein